MHIQLLTARAEDLARPPPHLRRGIEDGFSSAAEGRVQLAAVLAALLAPPRPAAWGAYWACRRSSASFVGLCGFKGSPSPQGGTEIAYYTFPRLEGRGAATAMAHALADQAHAQGARCLVAHTLPGLNASGRVLARAGFLCRGEAEDPEDGLVWRWTKRLG